VNAVDALVHMLIGSDQDDHGARLAALARRLLDEGRG
jgi:hypothetical protein